MWREQHVSMLADNHAGMSTSWRAATPSGSHETIAVISRKGGAGKTTIALNLAHGRIGKKAVVVCFEPDAVRQLKLIGIEKGVTMQEMMRESLNDFFTKNRKAEIA
jgi:nitrogenase subunit NifH